MQRAEVISLQKINHVPRLNMLNKVLVLKPRLDVMFKQGAVPEHRSPLPPERQHWLTFINSLTQAHRLEGDEVTVLEKPLWQFTSDDAISMVQEMGGVDACYIPHRQKWEFELPEYIPARYYMQTVFPDRFTIDERGWGYAMSSMPLVPDGEVNDFLITPYRARAVNGQSKFAQPIRNSVALPVSDYILFICQLPHDQTIQFFSQVSVQAAMERAMDWAHHLNLPIIVKGHPVNPGSMAPLQQSFMAKRRSVDHWLDSISIHDCIANARAAVCVNSGSGLEVMLHGTPLYVMGNAEYELACRRLTIDGPLPDEAPELTNEEIVKYNRVLTKYLSISYNGDIGTLRKRIQAGV